ncbi:MAG: sulfatase-like hydrolase/transferase [Hyphomicrobiaceae bacterium]
MSKTRKGRRPNFLVFLTDQQQAGMIGCYGHPVVKTRHIDQIAARGMRFDRYYVATPSCMPNRASLLTGRMPSAHGLRVNGIPLARDTNTFVDLLLAAGYATGIVGKGHLQPMVNRPPLGVSTEETIDRPPGGRRFSEARRPRTGAWSRHELDLATMHGRKQPYYGFEHVRLCTGHGDVCGADYLEWLLARDPDGLKKMGPAHALKHDYVCPQAWRTALPARHYPTTFVAESAVEYLANRRETDDDRPFFLCVSFPDPHHPFTPPGKYWGMYDPKDVPLPANFHGGANHPPHLAAAYAERRADTAKLDGYGAVVLTERETREAIALTCGMITMIDDAVGTVMKALAASGEADDTVVVFTSDHGDLLGDHGLMLKGPLHYQSLIRVPLVWSDRPAGAAGKATATMASTIDIAPTILERAGITPYNGIQGRSLLQAIAGASDTDRALLVEDEQQGPVLSFEQPTRVRTIVTSRHRLSIYSAADWGELYDLESDPHELVNLWADRGSARIKCALLERLAHLLMQTDDTSPAPIRLA